MNKKQKIKRIEELLMEHHIHNGLYPTSKTLKLNRKYLLDEVRKLVTRKSKVTTPKTDNVVIKGSNLLYSHVTDKRFDRWYVDSNYTKYIVFQGKDFKYGVGVLGLWIDNIELAYPRNINRRLILATDEQILERLSAYANSIGIKHNGFVTLLTGYKVKLYNTGDCIVKESNSFIFGNQVVMQGGVWATAAKQADTPTTYINHNKK
jgi:hypothetical protein